MGPKRKLLATTSSQAQGACPDHMKDRFSNLPDEVAHQILSSVSILDLTRFGTLSKKCRELYLSTPSLNFDEFNNWNKSSYAKQFKLLSSLDKFLVHRRENKIQCFRICWSLSYGKAASLYNELYRVVTWIHMAVRCNVEVLDLELRIPDTTRLELPSCIFLCGSLRSLSVHCNKILTAPSLELWLELVHGAKQITISSSSLETLRFISCYAYYSFQNPSGNFHLNISGERLEDIYIDWKVIPTGHSISIFAPNLKHLKWIGTLASRQYLEKLMCLEKAEIFLHPRSEDFSKLFSVLSSIHSVKLLVLNEETTKALTKERRSLPRIFDNLGHICIQSTCLNDGLVPALASLFRGMRHLNTFHMKYEPIIPLLFTKHVEVITASRFDREYWKSQNLAIIDQLEEVTVELSSGSNELEFARYILEGAKNLKKMVIVYLPHQSTRIEAVNEIEMNSPATIVFKKRPRRPKPSYSP
ncbi:PREDICTED: F-box/LRR-repeat [Prunus dulcis]|uniref:PREDICTED: F-box/LRR-repeat n=1 Tax=Prunus dulcis TaxID=3755 RepID=A0A5E4F1A8_PRUDU|nr:PREDICTED: F-box/LRR-repeat [Prunus dulcis]